MSRERLYLWPIIIAVGLVLIFSNLLWLFPFIADVEIGAARYQNEIARRVAGQADFFLEKKLRAMGGLALDIVEVRGSKKKATLVIEKFLARHSDFITVELTPAATPYGEYTISSLYSIQGRKVIVITTPLPYTAFDIKAVVTVGEVISMVSQESVGNNGRVFIVDGAGNVVFHPYEGIITPATLKARSFIAQGGTGIYIDERGNETFAVAVVAPGIGWIAVAEDPLSEAWANKYGAINLAWALMIVGVFFVIILIINFKKILAIAARERQLREAKTEYISLLAHQLRTPLAGTKWQLKTLLDGDWGAMNAKQKKFLTRSYETNEQMIVLVRDLLNITRIEEGRYDFALKKTDIGALCARVVSEFRIPAREADISLVLKKPREKERIPLVALDDEKMEMALSNLIDNAIRYNQPEGCVEMGYKCVGKNMEIWVKDTGVGIPRRQQHQLFAKFFRADNVVKMQVQGFGLGLFLVKNIIEGHGGTIAVKSKENEGTLFTISLPIR